MLLSFYTILAAVCAAVIFLRRKRDTVRVSKSSAPLPPGPPARWFWQNPFPTTDIARTLTDLVAEYGPVISLRQGSRTTIIVGRVDAASEILEKEGGSTADRPYSIAARELWSKGLVLALEDNNDRFRRLRRAIHGDFQPKEVQKYKSIQNQATKNLVVDTLNKPEHFREHALRYSADVILRITYGKDTPTSTSDPEVQRIHMANEHFRRANRPGAFLVDRIPILKYFPGYGRQLDEWHRFDHRLYTEQIGRVKNLMASIDKTGACGPSFARSLLESADEHQMSYDEVAHLAGGMFAAGAQTVMFVLSVVLRSANLQTLQTAITMMNAILAAASHPDAQARVQRELDQVVGRDRSPSWEDASSLPQLNAFIMEVARWKPVTPFGIAHRVSKDIIWRGQLIPAGADIFGCHLAISRDPSAFPDGEKFDPQRWLDKDGHIRTDLKFSPYGFGRRICPGMHLANNSLFMTIANILWSFRVLERADAPVNKVTYTDALTSAPVSFVVEFVPRINEDLLKIMMGTNDSL
ncbi:hypothetical protein ID866_10803 [Astraeus odoratus]|nr:hypothetical protein ID866_10803 [Astraeus odoratus]